MHETKGLGPLLLCLTLSPPLPCWAGQEWLLEHGGSGLSGSTTCRSLENEGPEDATHLPCEVSVETSTLCTATQSP